MTSARAIPSESESIFSTGTEISEKVQIYWRLFEK